MSALPQGWTPTRDDWRAMSVRLRGALEDRIAMLERTPYMLDGSIGCGCLLLDRRAL